MNKILDDFHKQHNIVYELRAVIDGKVLVKYTDTESFGSVSGYADLADQAIFKMALKEKSDEQDAKEQIAEANLTESAEV